MNKKISLIISGTILLANASVNSSNMGIVKDRDISKISGHISNQNDRSTPQTTLIKINNDGFLYGTPGTGGNFPNDCNRGMLMNKKNSLMNIVGTSKFNQQLLTTLYQFSGSAGMPIASLMTTNNDRFLYGTTVLGGNYGTIFKIDHITGELSTLYEFLNQNDGTAPQTTLITFNNDGFLYGTTGAGGNFSNDCISPGCGTLFKINPITGEFSSLYKFSGSDGAQPTSLTTLANDGFLYGTTKYGGFGYGEVFKINPVTKKFIILHKFSGQDGSKPFSSLITIGNGQFLYGVTKEGGNVNNAGSIYKINPITGEFVSFYKFSGPDGAVPFASLTTFNNDGYLYGTTGQGGDNNNGTIFRINSITGEFKTLYMFPYGGYPQSSLTTFNNDGYLYGTTNGCGMNDALGTIYRINPTTGEFKTLYQFSGSDGAFPVAALTTMWNDEFLYGITEIGGSSFNGTIFKFNPNITSK